MKILNEANLVYFSTCQSHVTKEGWLLKRGDVNKHFHKRWFVLKGNLLFYFEKHGDKEPNGVIILEGYTVELAPNSGSEENFTFMICFNGSSNSRKYVLQAESQKVMEDWMRVITCASYDYMKIMVAELKAQLDDLTSQELSKELEYCKKEPDSRQTSASALAAPSLKASAKEGSPNFQRQSKTRANPFDSHKTTELDVFGQTPFVPTQNTTQISKHETIDAPPTKPGRRKRLRKKIGKHLHHSKHKEHRDTGGVVGPAEAHTGTTDSSVRLSETHSAHSRPAQFYTDATSFYPPDQLKVRTESRFLNLHNKYGQMIQHVLENSYSNSSTTDEALSNNSSSDSEKTISTEEKLIDF